MNILHEIMNVCKKTGLEKSDLLLEIDLKAGADGTIAPA